MRHIRLTLLLLSSLCCYALAQSETKPVIADTLPFSTMLGTWEGEGWSMMGPDKRATFKQTEHIEAKADGNVIAVEGTGRDPKTGDVSFEAFATAAIDHSGKVLWTAYNSGNILNVELKTTDTSFQWHFDVEGGQIRYTSQVEGDTWHETGEFSPDGGKTWVPTLEMTLKRTSQ